MTEGYPKLKKIVIGGIDVSSYVMTFSVEETLGESFKKATIGLRRSVNALIDYSSNALINTAVTIQRGVSSATETYIFRGSVEKTEFKGAYVIITCKDKLDQTKTKTVNKSYDSNIDASAGVISEIFKDLINSYTNLTADNTSVQNSGTVFIRKKFVLRRSSVFDACKQLADMIDWQFYYNPVDDLVYFEPKGYTTSTQTITSSHIVRVPKWEIDETNMFNKIIVKGVQQEVATEEGPYLLNGVAQSDWTTTSVTLDNKPVQVKVLCDTSNPPTTEKVMGFEDASSSFDYTVDPEEKKIIWSDTFTPTTSHYAIVQYSYMVPTPVIRKNAASIAEFEEEKERSVFKDDLKNVDDVAAWAQKQVNVYGYPFYKTDLLVKNITDLQVGKSHEVSDTINGINGTFLITKLKQNWPYRYDEITIGDKELRTSEWSMNVAQRLKRLEEKQSDNEDVLNQFVDNEQNVAIRTVHSIYSASPRSNVLYYADPNQGEWGTHYYGEKIRYGLICYFSFDTNANDDHASYDATVNGATHITNGQKAGKGAYSFDGSNDNIQIPAAATNSLAAGTLSFWLKMDDESADYNIFAKNSAAFRCQYSQSRDDIYFSVNGEGSESGAAYTDVNLDWTQWHHIVCIWDGTNKYIYVDGSVAMTRSNTSSSPSSGNLYLGQNSVNNIETLAGKIDEVAIWNRPLTAIEVTALYNSQAGWFYDKFDFEEPVSLSQRTHTNNIYFEDFWDDQLTDHPNTTATINTSTHALSFTRSQKYISDSIFKNKTTTITTAKLTIPAGQITSVANLTFYLSADGGSNWEQVTLNTKHVFTNTGLDLRYKIVASDTASITFTDSFGKSLPLKIEVNI